MQLLTLEEVMDRIRAKEMDTREDRQEDSRTRDRPTAPEFHVPAVTRKLANFLFST